MAKAIASDAKPGAAAENAPPLARDPKLAVEEEYQLARRLNTVQSLELLSQGIRTNLWLRERGPICGCCRASSTMLCIPARTLSAMMA